MTNNGVSTTRNLANVVYDSGADAPIGRKRVGISATEIELLDDIPPTSGTGTTVSNNAQAAKRVFETQTLSSDKQKQANNYQALSYNRDQPKPNVVYQDGNDHSAFDKLIDKYAPDAIPQNLMNSATTTRQPLSQINTGTNRDEQSVFTFPTAATSNNYSTVIRPKSGQTPSNQSQTRNNNNQPSTQQRPITNYDSFQSFTSPPQQPSQSSVSIKTNNGNVTQVVPGKLYNLHDDPLHLLYDRQPPASANSQQQFPRQQSQPPFKTTFQPSNNFQIAQGPQTVMFTNDSQRYPSQAIPITSDPSFDGVQPFDLGVLIKRVQQDYLREIQPFVSSVKFVEKDQEYGQSLADVGFVTPVTVRKGFSRQADDILRRSAGRQDRHQPTKNRPQARDRYSDDEEEDDDDDYIEELRPSKRHQRLEKLDSKQSFTSVTSISTTGSDYDSQYSSLQNRDSGNARYQATSTSQPKVDQTKVPPPTKDSSTTVPSKPIARTESDKVEKPSVVKPSIAPKLATRISSDQRSETSSQGSATDDQGDDFAKYNEHENAPSTPSKTGGAVSTLISNSPVVNRAATATRDRSNKPQRSEDIHPAPPIIPGSQSNPNPSTNTRSPVKRSETEESATVGSGSDKYSESEDDSYNHSIPSVNRIITPTVNQSSVQQNAPTANRGAGGQAIATSAPPSNNQRNPSATATAPNSNTPTTNSRVPASQTAPATTDNNARQAAKPGANPNIHFVPPDQRTPATERTGTGGPPANQPAATSGGAAAAPPQTGSTRLFQGGGDSKTGARQKEAPTSIGSKIKNIFRRK